MPPKHTPPAYRRQKRPGKADSAFVVLDGVRHYLGAYDSPESQQAYHRLLAERLVSGGAPAVPPNRLTVAELVDRHWQFATEYYRLPGGGPSPEIAHLRRVLRMVNKLYSSSLVTDFGPLALKAVRSLMIERGQGRIDINRQVGRIRRVFRWGVGEEIVPPSVLQALEAVAPLKRGRCAAKETEPVRPVPDAHVEAVLPHVTKQVAALIRLQRLTAARGGELLIMRPVDLTMCGDVWIYRPQTHKNAYRGHQRIIPIGPKSQEILRPFLSNRPVDSFMFDPREGVAEIKSRKAASKRRPDQKPNRKKTNRCVRDRYDANSYRKAITRGCKVAGIPLWHPHQLRHSAGTAVRRDFGLEGAQIILGHRHADTSEIYAEINTNRAVEIARKIG